MTQIPDRLTALIAILKADAAVSAQVGTRVFGGELPPAETASMPRKATVISHGGGLGVFGGGYQEYGDTRVDARCYGETPLEADDVWRAAYGALKQMRRTLQGTIYVHWARPSGGPLSLRDPDTDWPYVFSSFQVLAAEAAHA